MAYLVDHPKSRRQEKEAFEERNQVDTETNLVQQERNMTNISGPYDNKIKGAMEQPDPTNCRAVKIHRDLQL